MHTSESRVKCYKTNKFIVLVNLGVSVTPLWAVEANSVHYKQQEYLRMHFTLPRLSDWSRAKERVKRRRGERRESSEAKLPLKAPLLYWEAQGKRKKREKKFVLTNWFLCLFIASHLLHHPQLLLFSSSQSSFTPSDLFSHLPPHSSAVFRTESSPRILQSSLRRFCISGMPASWVSSRCFSSVRERRVAVSSCSKRQPPSPSNCSRWVWYFLEVGKKD